MHHNTKTQNEKERQSNGSEEEDNSVQGTYTTILLAKYTHRTRLFAIPWYYDKIPYASNAQTPDYSVILFQKQQRVRG